MRSILDFLEIPLVPNFVRIKGNKDGKMNGFPIHELSDAEIKKLGKAWTEKLLENAKKKRKG